MNGWGALIGLAYGAGAASIAMYSGPWRALHFHRLVRIALHGPSIRRHVHGSLRMLGTARQHRIEQRQLQAGDSADASGHVLHCLTGAVIGIAGSAAVLVVLMGLQQLRKPFAAMLLIGIAAVSGWLIADMRLSSRVRARQRAAAVALPAFVEAIALAVGAGAALPHALQIVADRTSGVLTDGLRTTVHALRDGRSFDSAMAEFGARFPFPSMIRFIDALHIAMDRGTPVVDVLHAQAADARQESRRLLLESAGRREVGMLIPVIFFVLPAVVVVALYPGFTELSSLAT